MRWCNVINMWCNDVDDDDKENFCQCDGDCKNCDCSEELGGK